MNPKDNHWDNSFEALICIILHIRGKGFGRCRASGVVSDQEPWAQKSSNKQQNFIRSKFLQTMLLLKTKPPITTKGVPRGEFNQLSFCKHQNGRLGKGLGNVTKLWTSSVAPFSHAPSPSHLHKKGVFYCATGHLT